GPAVVLHNETVVAFGSDGKLVTTGKYAVRLLTRDGRRYASAAAYYLVSTGKVKYIDAWLMRPDGSVKHYDSKSVVDVIANSNDVYNEGRMKVIDGNDDAQIGYVFAYTTVSEEVPLFYQDEFSFQNRLPTLY